MAQLDQTQVEKAVAALLAWNAKQAAAKKDSLLDEENVENFDLIVTTKLMPEKLQVNPQRILLAHPLWTKADICLITKDPKDEFKNLLEEKGVTGLTKVLSMAGLRSKFKSYEAKRQLADSFDLFIADERILPLLPKAIGKKMFSKKMLPAPVNMTKKDLKNEFAKVLQSTFLRRNLGTCNAVRVASTTFTPEQVVENIMMAAPAIVDKLPKKWNNILSIALKTSKSAALPVYVSLPDQPAQKPADVEMTDREDDKEGYDKMAVEETKVTKMVKEVVTKLNAKKGKTAVTTTTTTVVMEGVEVAEPVGEATATPAKKAITAKAAKNTPASGRKVPIREKAAALKASAAAASGTSTESPAATPETPVKKVTPTAATESPPAAEVKTPIKKESNLTPKKTPATKNPAASAKKTLATKDPLAVKSSPAIKKTATTTTTTTPVKKVTTPAGKKTPTTRKSPRTPAKK
ncbi:ribosomal protein L1p/L10e family-domain-containing protein [Powellomyces hirtus]|nr:ribosomal protein L1p/L10e family-domain-containing protein [Powellomyces hirtus]KAI8917902.1 ribosomal protein L1p/L10e family-domain-containing protein [Powellomyces hirtus]